MVNVQARPYGAEVAWIRLKARQCATPAACGRCTITNLWFILARYVYHHDASMIAQQESLTLSESYVSKIFPN